MRLALREVQDADLPIFFEFQREPAAVHMAAFTSRDPDDREAYDTHWKRIRSDESVLIRAIEVDGEVVGNVCSFVMEGELEVTYWLGQAYWARGIATLALRAFLEIQTERPMMGRASKDNLGSIRVLEKCGFQHQGEESGFALARGEEIEEVVMVLC